MKIILLLLSLFKYAHSNAICWDELAYNDNATYGNNVACSAGNAECEAHPDMCMMGDDPREFFGTTDCCTLTIDNFQLCSACGSYALHFQTCLATHLCDPLGPPYAFTGIYDNCMRMCKTEAVAYYGCMHTNTCNPMPLFEEKWKWPVVCNNCHTEYHAMQSCVWTDMNTELNAEICTYYDRSSCSNCTTEMQAHETCQINNCPLTTTDFEVIISNGHVNLGNTPGNTDPNVPDSGFLSGGIEINDSTWTLRIFHGNATASPIIGFLVGDGGKYLGTEGFTTSTTPIWKSSMYEGGVLNYKLMWAISFDNADIWNNKIGINSFERYTTNQFDQSLERSDDYNEKFEWNSDHNGKYWKIYNASDLSGLSTFMYKMGKMEGDHWSYDADVKNPIGCYKYCISADTGDQPPFDAFQVWLSEKCLCTWKTYHNGCVANMYDNEEETVLMFTGDMPDLCPGQTGFEWSDWAGRSECNDTNNPRIVLERFCLEPFYEFSHGACNGTAADAVDYISCTPANLDALPCPTDMTAQYYPCHGTNFCNVDECYGDSLPFTCEGLGPNGMLDTHADCITPKKSYNASEAPCPYYMHECDRCCDLDADCNCDLSCTDPFGYGCMQIRTDWNETGEEVCPFPYQTGFKCCHYMNSGCGEECSHESNTNCSIPHNNFKFEVKYRYKEGNEWVQQGKCDESFIEMESHEFSTHNSDDHEGLNGCHDFCVSNGYYYMMYDSSKCMCLSNCTCISDIWVNDNMLVFWSKGQPDPWENLCASNWQHEWSEWEDSHTCPSGQITRTRSCRDPWNNLRPEEACYNGTQADTTASLDCDQLGNLPCPIDGPTTYKNCGPYCATNDDCENGDKIARRDFDSQTAVCDWMYFTCDKADNDLGTACCDKSEDCNCDGSCSDGHGSQCIAERSDWNLTGSELCPFGFKYCISEDEFAMPYCSRDPGCSFSYTCSWNNWNLDPNSPELCIAEPANYNNTKCDWPYRDVGSFCSFDGSDWWRSSPHESCGDNPFDVPCSVSHNDYVQCGGCEPGYFCCGTYCDRRGDCTGQNSCDEHLKPCTMPMSDRDFSQCTNELIQDWPSTKSMSYGNDVWGPMNCGDCVIPIESDIYEQGTCDNYCANRGFGCTDSFIRPAESCKIGIAVGCDFRWDYMDNLNAFCQCNVNVNVSIGVQSGVAEFGDTIVALQMGTVNDDEELVGIEQVFQALDVCENQRKIECVEPGLLRLTTYTDASCANSTIDRSWEVPYYGRGFEHHIFSGPQYASYGEWDGPCQPLPLTIQQQTCEYNLDYEFRDLDESTCGNNGCCTYDEVDGCSADSTKTENECTPETWMSVTAWDVQSENAKRCEWDQNQFDFFSHSVKLNSCIQYSSPGHQFHGQYIHTLCDRTSGIVTIGVYTDSSCSNLDGELDLRNSFCHANNANGTFMRYKASFDSDFCSAPESTFITMKTFENLDCMGNYTEISVPVNIRQTDGSVDKEYCFQVNDTSGEAPLEYSQAFTCMNDEGSIKPGYLKTTTYFDLGCDAQMSEMYLPFDTCTFGRKYTWGGFCAPQTQSELDKVCSGEEYWKCDECKEKTKDYCTGEVGGAGMENPLGITDVCFVENAFKIAMLWDWHLEDWESAWWPSTCKEAERAFATWDEDDQDDHKGMYEIMRGTCVEDQVFNTLCYNKTLECGKRYNMIEGSKYEIDEDGEYLTVNGEMITISDDCQQVYPIPDESHDIYQIVVDFNIYYQKSHCTASPIEGSFEILFDGDLCLPLWPNDDGDMQYVKAQCGPGLTMRTDIYFDEDCTHWGHNLLFGDLEGLVGECGTLEYGGLDLTDIAKNLENGEFKFVPISAMIPHAECRAVQEPIEIDDSDVLFDFQARIFDTNNCDGEGHAMEMKAHIHDPLESCKAWFGPGLGYFKASCHGQDVFTFQYWEDDWNCDSTPRFMMAFHLDGFEIPEVLSDLLDGDETVPRPWGYGTCINFDLLFEGSPSSFMVEDITCSGHYAVYNFAPAVTAEELQLVPIAPTPSTSFIPFEFMLASVSIYGPGMDCNSNTHGGLTINLQVWLEGNGCVHIDDQTWMALRVKQDSIEIAAYGDSSCSNAVDEEPMMFNWYDELIGGLEIEMGVCLELIEGFQFKFNEMGTNADSISSANGDAGADDTLFMISASAYSQPGCTGPSFTANMRISHSDSQDLLCREWIGEGMGYMKIQCHGRDMGSFMYFGQDSTCSSMPIMTMAMNIGAFTVPPHLVNIINQFGIFDPSLELPVKLGHESTCFSIVDFPFSFTLDEIMCVGHDTFNPFEIHHTLECGEYVETSDGEMHLVNELGQSVYINGEPVIINENCESECDATESCHAACTVPPTTCDEYESMTGSGGCASSCCDSYIQEHRWQFCGVEDQTYSCYNEYWNGQTCDDNPDFVSIYDFREKDCVDASSIYGENAPENTWYTATGRCHDSECTNCDDYTDHNGNSPGLADMYSCVPCTYGEQCSYMPVPCDTDDEEDGCNEGDDSKCTSIGNDCYACDKAIGMTECEWDEPATCSDGYIPRYNPGDDLCPDCTYTCFPPTCDDNNDAIRYEMKWCDESTPMYSVCSMGCGEAGGRCAGYADGACQHHNYDSCQQNSWALDAAITSFQPICVDGVHITQHFHNADCSGDAALETPESASCYGVGEDFFDDCSNTDSCSVSKQDCGDGMFCNHDQGDEGHCQSCMGVTCPNDNDDRAPCCDTSKECVCAEIYEPVCGVNFVTYSNECELTCAVVAKKNDGPCADTCDKSDGCMFDDFQGSCDLAASYHEGHTCAYLTAAGCDCTGCQICSECVCAEIYDPVCGVDGKTYSNECELGCAAVMKMSDGACPNSKCSVSMQDCGGGMFCNSDQDDEGHCQSCMGVTCPTLMLDRSPCCEATTELNPHNVPWDCMILADDCYDACNDWPTDCTSAMAVFENCASTCPNCFKSHLMATFADSCPVDQTEYPSLNPTTSNSTQAPTAFPRCADDHACTFGFDEKNFYNLIVCPEEPVGCSNEVCCDQFQSEYTLVGNGACQSSDGTTPMRYEATGADSTEIETLCSSFEACIGYSSSGVVYVTDSIDVGSLVGLPSTWTEVGSTDDTNDITSADGISGQCFIKSNCWAYDQSFCGRRFCRWEDGSCDARTNLESCSASDCSNQGQTTDADRDNGCACSCDYGYYGPSCSEKEECTSQHCFGNGQASGMVPDGCSCDCDDGWMGDYCEEKNEIKTDFSLDMPLATFEIKKPNILQGYANTMSKDVSNFQWGTVTSSRRMLTTGVNAEIIQTVADLSEKEASVNLAEGGSFKDDLISNVNTEASLSLTTADIDVRVLTPCMPSTDCSNHGTTTDEDSSDGCVCSCFPEWTGIACDTEVMCDDTTHCSNHGTASGAVWSGCSCTCDLDWVGADCSTPRSCNPSDCSFQGTSTDLDFSDGCACSCDSDWTGAICNTPRACTSNDCNNHGTTTDLDFSDGCACVCDYQYGGLSCEIRFDDPTKMPTLKPSFDPSSYPSLAPTPGSVISMVKELSMTLIIAIAAGGLCFLGTSLGVSCYCYRNFCREKKKPSSGVVEPASP